VTTVVAVEVLLARSGSGVEEVTAAVLTTTPGARGIAKTVTRTVSPFATEPRLHVTVEPTVHVPFVDVASGPTTPGGNTSFTTTLAAVAGPLLVIVSV
jgi:hypothetical protein